jgi:hypothetical protein
MPQVERSRLLLIVLWGPLVLGVAVGSEPAPTVLSPHLRGAVGWLPSDSDTLHVAQSFEIFAGEDPQQNGPRLDFRDMTQLAVLEGLFEPQHEPYLRPFVGRNVTVAVRGERNAEGVSNFGALRSEGCSIILFKEDLGNAAEQWTKTVRQGAKQIRKLNGHEVFVFDSTTVMEGWVKQKPWQGTFMVLLTSKCLLCASSDKYLEEVLDRLETAPAGRAFPDTLAEWQHVDTTAPAWMLRHVSEKAPRRSIVGVTMTAAQDRCRVVYLPLNRMKQDAKAFIHNRWRGKDPIVDWTMPYEFSQAENGSISASIGLTAFELGKSSPVWWLNSTRGER